MDTMTGILFGGRVGETAQEALHGTVLAAVWLASANVLVSAGQNSWQLPAITLYLESLGRCGKYGNREARLFIIFT